MESNWQIGGLLIFGIEILNILLKLKPSLI